ncbi:MAG: pyridoxamine 5'-phosphate oxidase family protein [Clostridia bacterium]|jgi:general stress protein 26|nr:pyridoxamine 5'-phosphate oxidase family protein [Clostridia bacterium]
MDLKKIEEFIDKQKVSFICSIDNENYPNVKAMLKPRKRNGLKEFYFSTNTSSMKVKQYQKNSNASIYFYHKGLVKYAGVMLKGKMEVLTDQETKNMIWKTNVLLNFTEEIETNNFIMKLLAKPYLKIQQKRYMRDLEKELN